MQRLILGFCSFMILFGTYATPGIAQAPPPPQQVSQTISPQELERFAGVWLIVRNINIVSLELFARLLRSEGITRDRATEIVEGGLNAANNLNAQEQQIIDRIQPLVRAVSRFRQVAIEREIQESGYSLEQYDQIGQTIEGNDALQQQFQQLVERLVEQSRN